jgi:hypothetical protein
MIVGKEKVVGVDSWMLEAGCWRLDVGGWRLEVEG